MNSTIPKKSMSIFSRIAVVIIVLILLMVGVLKLAERSTNALRLGIQDFVSEMTGGQAEVTEMPRSKLFPEVIFHVKGIVVRDRQDKDKTLMTISDAYVAIDFWRSFLGSGRFNGLEIRNVESATGFVLPRKLELNFAGISDPPPHEASPLMLLEGRYNNLPLMVTIEMRRHGHSKPKYDFGRAIPMTFKLGDLEASGFMERKISSVGFEKITAERGADIAVFSLKNIETNPLKAKAEGTLNDIPFSAELFEKDQLKTLTIRTPDPVKIEAFTDILRSDFGIDKDNKTFVVEVLPESNNKEKKQE